MLNSDVERSPVQNFYTGSVFITGATGFLGKLLVEKLLRSCPKIEKIFILIRNKNGLVIDDRHENLLQSEVFDTIRASGCLNKVVAVSGNIEIPGLGLSETDRKMLLSETTFVFHLAATVKFNLPLQQAIQLNSFGTLCVIKLSKKMAKLKAFVYVSTAFSNADMKHIEEKVYPLSVDPLKAIHHTVNQLEKSYTDYLYKNQVNTYTISKKLAESVVLMHSKTMPITIIRPSITTAAWQEPIPGWVDSVSGMTGFIVQASRGALRSVLMDGDSIVNMIPIDIATNTVITAPWYTSKFRKGTLTVFNCTSGNNNNPISWRSFLEILNKHSLMFPSRYNTWYPNVTCTKRKVKHIIQDTLLHLFPAALIDLILWAKGSKMIALNMYWKLKNARQSIEFVVLHKWDFNCENQKSLTEAMDEQDKVNFQTDITKIDWNSYIKNYVLGIRRHILKEPSDTLEKSLEKLKWMLWFKKIVKIIMYLLLFKCWRSRHYKTIGLLLALMKLIV